MSDAEAVARRAALLKPRGGPGAPRIAVLLGSGWSPLAAEVQDAVDVTYAELPAFPVLAVGGHAGLLRAGRLGGVEVLVARRVALAAVMLRDLAAPHLHGGKDLAALGRRELARRRRRQRGKKGERPRQQQFPDIPHGQTSFSLRVSTPDP